MGFEKQRELGELCTLQRWCCEVPFLPFEYWMSLELYLMFQFPPRSGFGGLVVSMLASGSNPAEAVGLFSGVKIPSMPSFGREVKPWVPCRRFAAR
jgi:hypothetical protein